MSTKKLYGWMAALFVALCLGCLAATVPSFVSGVRYAGSVHVTGHVVELRTELRYDRTSTYWIRYVRPKYEWTDEQGVTRSFWSDNKSYPGPDVGDSIDLEYLPGDPDSVRVKIGRWEPMAASVLSALGTGAGAAVLLVLRRRKT